MYFELTEEQKSIKEMATKYANEKIAPVHEEDERIMRFRREIVKEMGELGFWGVIIPEEYGGTNSGYLSSVLITEAVSKVSPAYAGIILTQSVGPGLAILKHGTDAQKQKYIPPLIKADFLGCFTATEPDAGSDVAAMRMTADEREDGFVLNGTKNWATNVPEADVALIFAYTDKEKRHHGISSFIIELKNNPGIETRSSEKLGQRCSKIGEIYCTDAYIPKDALLGEKGEGFGILMELLGNTRLFAASRALGVEEACLEKCIDYAKTRVQFGKPIGAFQMIQEQIAEMYVNHEVARVAVYQAAANKDKGIKDMTEISTVKYFATESCVKSAIAAIKIFGAYGYSMEYPIQRYLRDSLGFVITEGSSNIQKMIIARKLLDLKRGLSQK